MMSILLKKESTRDSKSPAIFHVGLVFVFLMFFCCADKQKSSGMDDKPIVYNKFLHLLTYNVHGLPDLMTDYPIKLPHRLNEISNKIKELNVDVVLMQEAWFEQLSILNPLESFYQKETTKLQDNFNKPHLSYGLLGFNSYPIITQGNLSWALGSCHGYHDCSQDCLTKKGFSWQEMTLDFNRSIVVYNIHADSGECENDFVSRKKQFLQLSKHVKKYFPNHALIIAGDTNMYPKQFTDFEFPNTVNLDLNLEEQLPSLFASQNKNFKLEQACLSLLKNKTSNMNQKKWEGFDRVFYRSSKEIRFLPTQCRYLSFYFQDNIHLSDHPVLSVKFKIATNISQ